MPNFFPLLLPPEEPDDGEEVSLDGRVLGAGAGSDAGAGADSRRERRRAAVVLEREDPVRVFSACASLGLGEPASRWLPDPLLPPVSFGAYERAGVVGSRKA
jgi:hypothetical protein